MYVSLCETLPWSKGAKPHWTDPQLLSMWSYAEPSAWLLWDACLHPGHIHEHVCECMLVGMWDYACVPRKIQVQSEIESGSLGWLTSTPQASAIIFLHGQAGRSFFERLHSFLPLLF